jgi:predicted nuclease of predicted toxin-antitoxin system
MKLLLDECLPRKLKNHLPGHECHTVPEAGWAGKKNGELLSLAQQSGFQVFLTLDRGLEYEQNLNGREIAVVLISARSSRLADLLPRIPSILDALRSVRAGQLARASGD